jgi:GTP-binding protein
MLFSSRKNTDRKRRGERNDSIDELILRERDQHLSRIEEYLDGPCESLSHDVCVEIKNQGLGRYKGWANQKRRSFSNPVRTDSAQILHQSRHGEKDLPKVTPWPEVALIGHSNCGKSALVNVLAAKQAKRGVAGVSDMAGWTEAINFYKLQLWSKQGPRVMLVDMPGYGLAVASKYQTEKWKTANMRYLCKRDPRVLRAVVVLVDATRGLCKEDEQLFDRLDNAGRPYYVALTKVDLLQQQELAACNAVLTEDLSHRPMLQYGQHGGLLMVSSLHGQGIHEMWKFLMSDTLRLRKPKEAKEEEGDEEGDEGKFDEGAQEPAMRPHEQRLQHAAEALDRASSRE